MKRIVLLALLLTACTPRYSSLHNSMGACGYPTAKFSSFHDCMEEKVTFNPNGNINDYYNNSSKEVLDLLDQYEIALSKKKITQKEAYADLDKFVNGKIVEEQKSAQVAAAVIAVGAVGAAGMYCYNTGGCGGGGGGNNYSSNISGYAGNCPCPYDRDINGNLCGARSAYSRSGGASPMC